MPHPMPPVSPFSRSTLAGAERHSALSKNFELHFLSLPSDLKPPVTMDLHPTPFPGKRRPLGNPTMKKERDQPKPGASHAQSKPKRAFGRNLSANITIERPSQKPLAAKPWKPSGVSKNTVKPAKNVVSALSCAGGAKSGSSKKSHHVTFLEMQPPAVAAVVDESIKVSHDDLLVCTPVLSTVILTQETPYQSAENCSKCRLDRLETSSYWISQVKLAEATGKHFVAAAFFRLALECEAQPLVILQNELKHYRDRHGVIFMESLWDDLCRDYGLKSEQADANSGNVDIFDAVLVEQFDSKCTVTEEGDDTDDRDYDKIDKPEDILENFEVKNVETEGIIFAKHSEDGMVKLSSSMDSLLNNVQGVESPSSNSVLRGRVSRSAKTIPKKSNFVGFISCDSGEDIRTSKAIISDKMVGQAGVRNSGNEPAWKKKDKATIGSTDLLKGKSIAEEHYRSDNLDENANFVEDRENVEGEDNTIWNQPGLMRQSCLPE